MVRVWLADVTPLLLEERYQKYYQELPEWRKEKADKCGQSKARAQSAGAWSLWSRVRSYYGISKETVYNLSHSGRYALCAFSDNSNAKVGCDVEEVKKFRESVARRFFCQSEYEHIMAKEEEDRARLFYRYWVMKESFMKATRRGMALDMRTFEIGWEDENRPVLLRKPKEYPEEYYYHEYVKKGVNAGIAVCTTDGEIDDMLHILEL